MKKLTISKTTYGVSDIPVVQLDYNNGAPIYTHELHTANAWTLTTILDSIDRAQRNGYTIEFVGFTADKVDAISKKYGSEGDGSNGKR
jgi:hypothetical protein